MKRAARLPLTFAPGLDARSGDAGSRNMAAQIDSDEADDERTLYRGSGGARPPLAQDGFTPHWRGIHDEVGRLTVALHFNATHYLPYSLSP